MAVSKASKKASAKKSVKKPAVKKAVKKAAPKKAKVKTKRKPNAKFMAPLTPSAALAEIVGAKPLPRTEVSKKIWAYIKKNGLQDKKEKRMINADAKMKALAKKDKFSMFEIPKFTNKHLS